MKRFLIAATVLAVMGVATGYAQDDTEQVMEQTAPDTAAPPPQAAQETPDPFAKMIIAKSQIKAVTVYNGRAKITRVAEVDIPEGAHTVAFKDLPPSLLADSLRAAGSARAEVKLGAIAGKQVMTSRLTSAREQELHDKIQNLTDQKAPIVTEDVALDAQEKFLTSIGQQATLRNNENLAQIDLKPDQWTAAAQAIHNGIADVYKARTQQSQKLRDIDLEINKLQRELSQIGTGERSIFTVLVPVEAGKATKLTLEISYQMPNATWEPIYDARVTTDSKTDMKLTQYGSVRQRTGEDWTGVALTLSTAQPQRGSSLPDLQPMWINGYAPNSGSGFFGKEEYNISSVEGDTSATKQTVGAEVNDPEYQKKLQEQSRKEGGAPAAAAAPPPPIVATFVAALINTGGYVSEYKIAGPSNVPSDGTETKLLVGNFAVDSKLQIHIKPQLSTDAYLVVHGKLKGDSPVLPGHVSLFRDEAYVGQASLPLLRPDEEYDLYFGVDDQVAVKRKVLKDEMKQQGVISKDKVLERHYVTELQNLHNVPIDIIVKETTPAPQNEKIKADIDKDTTTPGYVADADNIKGLLNWQFRMEPREKKDLKLDWTVSWPSDFTVTGL